MGYTHYLENKPAFTDSQWVAFCQDVRKLLASYEGKIPLGDGHGDAGTKPYIGKTEIAFNGIGEDAHETAYVCKGQSEFQFCKTARKPYDEVVVKLYKLIRQYLPATELSSDGGDEVFGGKKIIVNGKWTYLTGDFSVAVGDTVILPPSKFREDDWEGTVTAISSNYDGVCKTIVGVVAPVAVPKTVTVNEEIYDIIRCHAPAALAAELTDKILGVVIARLKE
jgi:hypothetical protein